MNKHLLKFGAGISLLGLALLLDALFFEKYFFEIKRFPIGNKKGNKALQLLLITDLHFKKVYWPYYERLARTINNLQPDLILIAGDTFDGGDETAPVKKFLSRIKLSIPKVAILGNHDHKSDVPVDLIRKIYERYNCDLLVNQTKAYSLQGERLVVTGLDDFIESEGCLSEALTGVGKEEHHLLLIHSPLQQEEVLRSLGVLNASRKPEEQVKFRYIFAGHNHGGQVRALGLVPKLPLKSGDYIDGWYNQKSPYLYLSKGFGTSTVPFRFGARSEIVKFSYYL